MSGVSLQHIGVRSSARTWLTLAMGAVLLVGLGAAGAYFAMGGDEPAEDNVSADDPFLIGTPLPRADDGSGVDVVVGKGRDTETDDADDDVNDDEGAGADRGSRKPSASAKGATKASRRGKTDKKTSSEAKTSGGSSASSPAGAGAGEDSSGGSASTGAGEDSEGDANEQAAGDEASSGETKNGDTKNGDTKNGDTKNGDAKKAPSWATDPVPPEEDIAMNMYGARVRYVVQRYYASRAQSCFEHATRNNPSVNGTVIVSMTIGGNGHVTRAAVTRNTTGDESLGSCLKNRVSAWQLPPPPEAGLELEMPFSR